VAHLGIANTNVLAALPEQLIETGMKGAKI
jgi:hypothetical protein